jgi:hypothetical protein
VADADPPLPVAADELLPLAADPEVPELPAEAAEAPVEVPDVAPPDAVGLDVAFPEPVGEVELALESVPPEVAVPSATGAETVPPVSPPVELEPAADVPEGPDCAEPAVVLVPVPELPPPDWPALVPVAPELAVTSAGAVEEPTGLVGVMTVTSPAGVELETVSAKAARPVIACTATNMSTAAPTAATALAANLKNRDTIASPHGPELAGADNPYQ